jgi:uncharacterized protein (DUF427 family)
MSTNSIIKSIKDGTVIASSINATSFEGYVYFNKSEVNLDLLTKKDSMYTCPIKKASCDYYYLESSPNQEICWCYESIPSKSYEPIEGKIGFYKGVKGLTEFEIIEED